MEKWKRMAIYLIVENIKQSGRREIPIEINENGYYKLDRECLIDCLPQQVFSELIKRGIYINGKDSLKDSNVYIQRFVPSLYYNMVELEGHHLMKNKAQSDILHIIPLKTGIHQQIDRLTDIQKGIDKSIEQEKELQIIQFGKKPQRRLQNRATVIESILKLKVSGKSTGEIIEAMKPTICDKKVREHLKFFHYASGFLEYLKNQEQEEFAEEYSKLGKEWQFVVEWECIRDKNLQEFWASNRTKTINKAKIPANSNGDKTSYLRDYLEDIF